MRKIRREGRKKKRMAGISEKQLRRKYNFIFTI